ncbi:MAG: hypothetical protein J7K21_06090 [Desulfurococcales archaeon]|nr:hypothetical protein [Desulfurococcales archaeon]
MKEALLKCRIENNEVLCTCLNKKCGKVAVEAIDHELWVLKDFIDTNTPLTYSIEIEIPVPYRVVCNGEYFGEFTWGAQRITRWDTTKPVENIMCLIGKYNIRKGSNYTVVYQHDLDQSLIIDIENIIRYYKYRISSSIYDNYIIIDLSLPKKLDLYPPLVSSLDKESLIQTLIRSTITINNIKVGTSNIKRFIDEAVGSILGKNNVFTENILSRLLNNPSLLYWFINYSRDKLEIRIADKWIILKVLEKGFVRVVGEKGILETTLEANKEYSIEYDVLGPIRSHIFIPMVKDFE